MRTLDPGATIEKVEKGLGRQIGADSTDPHEDDSIITEGYTVRSKCLSSPAWADLQFKP